jgi:Mrp family chromosome partitioning ATPase
MKVYLIAGANCEALRQILQKGSGINVVKSDRNIEEAYYYLKDNRIEFDIILLADQGINCSISSFGRLLSDFMDLLGETYQNSVFKFITKEPQYENVFKQVTDKDERFYLYFVDKIKVPVSLIKEVCGYKSEPVEKPKNESTEGSWWNFFRRTSQDERKTETRDDLREEVKEEPKKEPKKEIKQEFKPEIRQEIKPEVKPEQKEKPREEKDRRLFRWESKPANEEPKKSALSGFVQSSTDKLSFIPGSINRIVVMTGHRGSGVTGTAANLAVEASMQGLRTIILDMDLEYKTINLYFSKFGDEVNVNPDLAGSLIKCLLKPESYDMNSCRINNNLSVVTLAYSIESNDKMMDLINITRILTLITVLKSKFNLVILDMPIHILKRFSDILIHVDTVGLCLNNSLYSVINTVSSIGEFDDNLLTLLAIKSRVIITKYNERNVYCKDIMTPDTTCEILNNLCDMFTSKPVCAGAIPYYNDYDMQVDSGKKLCTINDEFKSYYIGILNNLFR